DVAVGGPGPRVPARGGVVAVVERAFRRRDLGDAAVSVVGVGRGAAGVDDVPGAAEGVGVVGHRIARGSAAGRVDPLLPLAALAVVEVLGHLALEVGRLPEAPECVVLLGLGGAVGQHAGHLAAVGVVAGAGLAALGVARQGV